MAEPIAIKHTLHGLHTNYGLTREEVAEYIGIGPNAVTRYEKGAQGLNFSKQMLDKIKDTR